MTCTADSIIADQMLEFIMTMVVTVTLQVANGLRWLFGLEKKTPIDLSSAPLRRAYDEGYIAEDTELSNPYLEGTKLYDAWECGSNARNRHEMSVL